MKHLSNLPKRCNKLIFCLIYWKVYIKSTFQYLPVSTNYWKAKVFNWKVKKDVPSSYNDQIINKIWAYWKVWKAKKQIS